jgi:hypothetical protein
MWVVALAGTQPQHSTALRLLYALDSSIGRGRERLA